MAESFHLLSTTRYTSVIAIAWHLLAEVVGEVAVGMTADGQGLRPWGFLGISQVQLAKKLYFSAVTGDEKKLARRHTG